MIILKLKMIMILMIPKMISLINMKKNMLKNAPNKKNNDKDDDLVDGDDFK